MLICDKVEELSVNYLLKSVLHTPKISLSGDISITDSDSTLDMENHIYKRV